MAARQQNKSRTVGQQHSKLLFPSERPRKSATVENLSAMKTREEGKGLRSFHCLRAFSQLACEFVCADMTGD